MKLQNQGFSTLLTILLIVVVMAAAGGSWYILQKDDANYDDSQQSTQTSSQTETETQAEPQTLAGTFTGVAPKTGSGSVTLVKDDSTVVRLEDDFKVQDGPDLFVGFGNDGKLDHDTLFAELKAFDGQQEYQVPDSIDTSKYSQVFIYCKEFSVDFAVATLQ